MPLLTNGRPATVGGPFRRCTHTVWDAVQWATHLTVSCTEGRSTTSAVVLRCHMIARVSDALRK